MLLDEMGIGFRVVVPNVEEIIPVGMGVSDAPAYLAALKGRTIVDQLQANELLLAADTVVIHNGELLGKPADVEDAKRILRRLSGNKHDVISGVFISDGRKEVNFSVQTSVHFDPLRDDEIDHYIKVFKPLDKAGSYGIQDWIGWAKINHIEGSYSNIIGLPTREVFRAIQEF